MGKHILYLGIIAWLIALLVVPKGPRWGIVIGAYEMADMGWSVCVEGHIQTGCYDVDEETYNNCHKGMYWEQDHCEYRVDYPDAVPQSN